MGVARGWRSGNLEQQHDPALLLMVPVKAGVKATSPESPCWRTVAARLATCA